MNSSVHRAMSACGAHILRVDDMHTKREFSSPLKIAVVHFL